MYFSFQDEASKPIPLSISSTSIQEAITAERTVSHRMSTCLDEVSRVGKTEEKIQISRTSLTCSINGGNPGA